MWRLYHKLLRDELGSASAELGLVTGVTVGALFMGVSDFAATVNREFKATAQVTSLMTIEEQQATEDDQEDKEVTQERRRIRRFRRAEDNLDNEPEQ